MDVLPAEAEKLRQLLTAWSEHDDYELEATFGPKSAVDATSFFAIAQRLKAKGYEPMPQEDRLNIILPERIRMTIVGSGIIQQYCRDNTLTNKPYVAIIKDRTFVESNIDFDEYDTRVKLAREVELSSDDARLREILERWAVHRKAFRLIRRWSFAGKGIVFDLSIVRHTRKDARGEYRWVRTFNEQNFIADQPTYEVEVELKHAEGVSIDMAMKNLIAGIGEVLRGYQNNSVLIRKSVKERVLTGYKQLTGSHRFRGVAPVTLEVKNMTSLIEDRVPNIRKGYNVTDKADGLRVLGFVDRKGELFMIDMSMNVYRTGLVKEACANSLVDGEWVTNDKEGKGISQLMLFDIYIAPGSEKVSQMPFYVPVEEADSEKELMNSRHNELKKWISLWMSDSGPIIAARGVNEINCLRVCKKDFAFTKKNPQTIFRLADRLLNKEYPYHTDGLIFTSNADPIPDDAGASFPSQFKWKPPAENTIDFLVNFEKEIDNPKTDKITIGINPDNLETVRHKTIRLYVGSWQSAAKNDPRSAVLLELLANNSDKQVYRPVLFSPIDYPDTMAGTCYRTVDRDFESGDEYVLTERTKEPIRDRSIVEMAYDPTRQPGWRWVPIRIRHDKTERLARNIAMKIPNPLMRTANGSITANSVWNSIHNPVTDYMIRTGSDEPNEKEIAELSGVKKEMEEVGKVYYKREATRQDMLLVHGLRLFHRLYIKDNLLYKTTLFGGGKKLLDLACGEGGDMNSWRRNNVSFVMGIDYSGNNITNSERGIYSRYLSTIKEYGQENVPPMVFAIGDCSRNIIDGSAGATSEERDIMRATFGHVKPEGTIPPYIERVGVGMLRTGADVVSCMFAIHYFFEDRIKFDGFLQNINDTLKVGGYFIGCTFDGERVFNLLRRTPKGQSKIGAVGDTAVWNITKMYDIDELSDDYDSLGHPVDIDFISIGTVQREFLVSFNFLVNKMRSIGCELLSDVEAREVGLLNSTNTFDVTYQMAMKDGKVYPMDDIVKQFSFLNRWFIFKRRGTTAATGITGAPEAAPVIATASTKKGKKESLENSIVGTDQRAPDVELPIPTGLSIPVPDEKTGLAVPTATIRRMRKKNTVETPTAEEPKAAASAADKAYAASEIFQFYPDGSQADVLKIGEPGAGRWLSLVAPFPIPDPEKPEVKYPTVEHYLAAMKYKLASNKPELAITLMSQEGKVHQKFIAQRLAETGAGSRVLTADRDAELLKAEAEDARFESRPQAMVKYGALFDETKWASVKDRVLTEALQYRWTHDKRLRKIIEAARTQNKYLLYYTGTVSGSELGGKRRSSDGRIDGANKVGKIYMQLANFPAY